MYYAPVIATLIPSVMMFSFISVLLPVKIKSKKSMAGLISVILVSSFAACIFALFFGTQFLFSYGLILVSLPTFIALMLFSSAKGIRFMFVILTALIFHQLICMILMMVRVYYNGYTPFYFVLCFTLFGALNIGGYFIRADFHKIVFTYKKEFWVLCPMLMVLFFLVRVFTPVINGNKISVDILQVSIITYLLIVMLYIYIAVNLRSLSKRLDAERDAITLRHQIDEAREYLTVQHLMQEKTMLYRHDIRHHLSFISSLLNENKPERIRAYISEVCNEIDSVTPLSFCVNETANLLLSTFAGKAKKAGVEFIASAVIPPEIPLSDAELCTLLSNALENAVSASSKVPVINNKKIFAEIKYSSNLKIMIKNTFCGLVSFDRGIPQSDKENHGYGVKSIVAITEKYGGLYSFEAEGDTFTLKIII